MIFSDLGALAKAGYKPADVKEILSMDAKKPAGNEEPAEIPAGASGQPEPEKEVAAAPPDPSQEIEQNNKNLAEQVEDLKKQLAKTQEDLAKAQQANTRTDSSGGAKKPTTDEQLQDLIRSYM